MNEKPNFIFENNNSGTARIGVSEDSFKENKEDRNDVIYQEAKQILDDYFKHGKPIPMAYLDKLFDEMKSVKKRMQEIIKQNNVPEETLEDTAIRLLNAQHQELIGLGFMVHIVSSTLDKIHQDISSKDLKKENNRGRK